MPQSNQAHAPQLLSLCSRAQEPQQLSPRATATGAHVPRLLKPTDLRCDLSQAISKPQCSTHSTEKGAGILRCHQLTPSSHVSSPGSCPRKGQCRPAPKTPPSTKVSPSDICQGTGDAGWPAGSPHTHRAPQSSQCLRLPRALHWTCDWVHAASCHLQRQQALWSQGRNQ